jgi:DNA-binding MarR family transcriptional regulator
VSSRQLSTPDRSGTAAVGELAAALERLASWLRRATPPMEWNSVALATLDGLARRGPQRVTDLVLQERISPPGMTGLVSRLSAADLVARAADPSDGRACLVTITPAGRDYLRTVHEARTHTLARHIATLRRDQQAAVAGAVAALDALSAKPITAPAQPGAKPITAPAQPGAKPITAPGQPGD